MFFPFPTMDPYLFFLQNEKNKKSIIKEDPIFYDNPENLSQSEINIKLFYIRPYIGPNSKKRFETLESYSAEEISKEEWIKKYTTKF